MELEGKPLSFWLQELICDDNDRRSLAAPLLSRFDEEFKAAVQATLSEPDFPTVEWLNALIDFLLWVRKTTSEMQRAIWDNDRISEGYKRYSDGVVLRLPNQRELDRLYEQQSAVRRVFGALGRHILVVPNRIFELLEGTGLGYAIEDLLREVADEVPAELLAALWERWSATETPGPYTLAALIQNRPVDIARLVGLLETNPRAVRVLRCLGPVAAQVVPECVPVLLAWLDQGERLYEAIPALGAVTRGQEVGVEPLLALSDSDDIWVKKAVLRALGDIATCSERVVPRLVAAFDDYAEPDSDDLWNSEHLVVARALGEFGADAAPAIPHLVARLFREGGECDSAVWRCLGQIGEPALAVLDILERHVDEEELAASTLEEFEESGNGFVVEATVLRLRRIQQERKRGAR